MTPTITEHRCGSTLYLTVPRSEVDERDALALLQKEAHMAGGTPTGTLLDAGILGEPEPTLWLLKASLTPTCRRCGSTTNVNANGCCGECQLRHAA